MTGGQLLASAWPLAIITISDHRPETGVTGVSSYLPDCPDCPAELQSAVFTLMSCSFLGHQQIASECWEWGGFKNDAWKEIVRQKSKVYFFSLLLCAINIGRYKSISVSGLTILIMMKYLLEVKRALLISKWPCFPTLYNTLLVGLVKFIFSRSKIATHIPWIEDNLRDANTNRIEENVVSEFTSSCSLYPQILPTGEKSDVREHKNVIRVLLLVLTQACVTVTCQRIHSRRPAVLLPLTITSGNLDILAISGTLNCLFSDDNMNVDEKAKLVTNENFQMISDERSSSRINLNKQPDRTLSSFLFESQFYENLQIVRWVVKSLFVMVWFQTWITAQRLFSRLSKKTTWSQIWDLTRREGGLPSSRPLRIPPCLILSIPTSEPLGNIPVSCISISVHEWLDMIEAY